jgi:hypothetical protein
MNQRSQGRVKSCQSLVRQPLGAIWPIRAASNSEGRVDTGTLNYEYAAEMLAIENYKN